MDKFKCLFVWNILYKVHISHVVLQVKLISSVSGIRALCFAWSDLKIDTSQRINRYSIAYMSLIYLLYFWWGKRLFTFHLIFSYISVGLPQMGLFEEQLYADKVERKWNDLSDA